MKGQSKERQILREIAGRLRTGKLPVTAAQNLAKALELVADGEDANVALGVKAPPPPTQRKLAKARQKWIVRMVRDLRRPQPDGGEGLTLAEALNKTAKDFRLGVDTVERYWDAAENMPYRKDGG